MSDRLKGLILKSNGYEKGETFYTIILKKRWFLPGMHKTARLYKNWRENSFKLEVDINEYDSRDYIRDIGEGNLEFVDEGELAELRGNIEELDKKTKKLIYGKLKIIPTYDNLYETEMQGISKLKELTINHKTIERRLAI